MFSFALIQVGYLIVEHEDCPELLQDKYWDECIPKEIPYTVGAEKYKKDEFIGSAEKTLSIKECDKVLSLVVKLVTALLMMRDRSDQDRVL